MAPFPAAGCSRWRGSQSSRADTGKEIRRGLPATSGPRLGPLPGIRPAFAVALVRVDATAIAEAVGTGRLLVALCAGCEPHAHGYSAPFEAAFSSWDT